ncbi:MAG TPA: Uma2 family endonuclease [Polyangiaceae bacterium]
MSEPAVRLANYSDVLAAPADKVAEVIRGVLHLSPRPGGPHGAAAGALSDELGPPFKRGRGGPGGWLIVAEPELHLQEHILVPDLAGWRRERLPRLERTAFISVTPDWVCEILSPRSARADRAEKKPLYAELGVSYLWLVDPEALTLETYQLRDGHWVELGAYSKDDRPRAVPFDAIELELAALWADVDPPPED